MHGFHVVNKIVQKQAKGWCIWVKYVRPHWIGPAFLSRKYTGVVSMYSVPRATCRVMPSCSCLVICSEHK